MKTDTRHPLVAMRQAAAPLGAFETADPAATIESCVSALNGKADTLALVQWDGVQGVTAVTRNGQAVGKAGTALAGKFPDPMLGLDQVLNQLAEAEGAVCFLHNAHLWLKNDLVMQAVWNLRDRWKAIGSTLVMLGASFPLPIELQNDVVVVTEPLPDSDEIDRVMMNTLKEFNDLMTEKGKKPVKITDDQRKRAVDTLLGITMFSVEQLLAMSITQDGLDMDGLVKLKRNHIAQLPGVEVREDKITFADIAGYDNVKRLLKRKISGRRPPRLVLWLDEADKAFAGSQTDTSGVTQDQIGTILTWMQDRLNEDRLSALLMVGFPGTGKSAVAMALRNEAQCETLRIDMGGLKDSLVGSSEKRIRAMLKTVDAMSGGHILVVATCNSVGTLPAPFISRFALGTYMFELPTPEENKAIWKLKRQKYEVPTAEPNPPSDGWTGREIQQCCFLANDLNITLAESSAYITPFCATGSVEIETLRRQANSRFLSASAAGFYRAPEAKTPQGRKMEVE